MWALMNDRVEIISKPDKVFTLSDLKSKFGISNPRKLALAKALFGDPSDNISNVLPRITPKAFGADLEACTRYNNERQWSTAFFRQISSRVKAGDKLSVLLWEKRHEVLKRELWIRLRQVSLTRAYARRDVQVLSRTLDWFEIVKKKKGFIEFAML
jgi:hypothetical protein